MTANLLRAQTPVATNIVAARVAVSKQLVTRLSANDAAATFFRQFNGGMDVPSAAWSARFAQLQQRPEAVLQVPLVLLSNTEILGAYAAFTRSGANGKPAIYLNETWVTQYGSAEGLVRILSEETGHAIDAYLNGKLETPGDEGELYAESLRHEQLPASMAARIASENDFSHLVLGGKEIIVEEAAIYFNHVYKAQGTTYTTSTNDVSNITRITGTGFKFTSTDPNDVQFRVTGNDVTGSLTYINASGTVVTVAGVISRQDKSGSTTTALYFVDPTKSEAYWMVIPGRESSYTSGTNQRTSSDPNFVNDMNVVLNNQKNAPIISVSSPQASEGSAYITFTVNVNPTPTASYSFSPSLTPGTATAASDYTNSMEYSTNNGSTWTNVSGTISNLPTSVSTVLIRVALIDDNSVEGNESFNLNIGSITGGGIINNGGAYGTATIQENDSQPATITQDDINKNYGDGTFQLTPSSNSSGSYTYSVTGATGVITLSGNTATIVGAGTTQVTITQAASAPYEQTTKVVSITIAKATLNATANNATKTYDGGAFSGGNGISYTGFVYSDNNSVVSGTPTFGGSAQGAVNAGLYAISVSGISAANYNISFTQGVLTINKAALTASVNNHTKTYDGQAYSGGDGISYAGFVNNETAATAVSGSISYGGTSQGAVVAGSYLISCSGLTASNYNITYVNGTLTINKAGLVVTANDDGKVYNGLPYNSNTGVQYSGFVTGETAAVLSGSLVYSGTSQGAVHVGTYVITPGGLTSDNYNINFAPGALTISPALLTISAADQAKNYDGQAYMGSYSVQYDGFVNNETASVLAGALTYGGTSQDAVNAGVYVITPGGLTSNDYTIAYSNGTLTIRKADPVLSGFDDLTKEDTDGTFALTAPTSTSDGSFSYTSINTQVAQVSGNTVTILSAGITTITAVQAATANYNSRQISLTLRVLTRPTVAYSNASYHFTQGTAISIPTPSITGQITGYSISPGLPAGLSFDPTTGVISGSPTAVSSAQSYTITVVDANGLTNTTTLSIEVRISAPTGLSYASPNTYTEGMAIIPLQPNVVGTVTSYSAVTPLPAGLVLDPSSGVISGVPTTSVTESDYTIRAANSSGYVDATVRITVQIPAPSGLSYSSPNSYTAGTTITSLQPTVSGAVTGFAIAPALPEGLVINASTGIISGTPVASSPQTSYTVTASNGTGSTTAIVSIAVQAGISYTSPSAPLLVGGSITPILPAVTGSGYTYSINPELPSGLSIDPATGIISGTPNEPFPSTTFTVTATNGSGSTTSVVTITVQIPAPSALSYTSPNTFTEGVAVTPLQPTVTGTVSNYSVMPQLPAGLSLNSNTGSISGTPTAASANTVYTITATNSSGATTAQTTITVQQAAPSALSYNTPNVFTAGTAIAVLTPAVSGNADTWSISPALPQGLQLHPHTGVISGTPAVVMPASIYTVTAANTTGSTTAAISIEVQLPAPSNLSYNSPNVFTVGTPAATLLPTVTGSVTSWSISPALPSGLVFNSGTGAISGTPAVTSTATVYTVTATNSTGSTSATLSLAVQAGLQYVSPSTPLAAGVPITPIPPAVTGTGFTYSIAPGLPPGLTLDPSTGIISGTPTGAFSQTTFTVTASNGQSSVAAPVTLGVVLPAPTPITYSNATLALTTGTNMGPLLPQVTGLNLTFSISPALPAGLHFDPQTGIISGTPSGIFGTATYTITASNASGSVSTSVTISATGSIGAFAPIAKTYGDPAFTISQPAAPAPGTYQYASSNPAVAAVGGNVVTITGTGTTTITATYTFAGGGTASVNTILTVQPQTLVVQAADASMCTGTRPPQPAYTISGFVYNENASVLAQAPVATTTATATAAPGTYPITVEGAAAANYTFVYQPGTLTVHAPSHQPQRMAPVDAVLGKPTQLNARSFGVRYQWTPALSVDNSTSPAPMATLQQETLFKVAITENNGCVVTDTVQVRIHNGPEVYVPSMFSPNGDGVNDVLYANPVNMQRLLYLRVYNDWGKLVFQSADFGKGWDGRFQGQLQPFATYVWMVSAVDKDGKTVNRTGTVTLVR